MKACLYGKPLGIVCNAKDIIAPFNWQYTVVVWDACQLLVCFWQFFNDQFVMGGIFMPLAVTIFYGVHKVFNCLGVALLKVMVAILNFSSKATVEIL